MCRDAKDQPWREDGHGIAAPLPRRHPEPVEQPAAARLIGIGHVFSPLDQERRSFANVHQALVTSIPR